MPRLLALITLFTVGIAAARAQDDGFKPMFNGKDLAGWVNVNCAPGTFYVKDNMIITTGKPTGYLRTERQYENFIVEFDWFHAPEKKRDKEISNKSGNLIVHKINDGNSGMFVWGDPIPAVGTGYTRSIEVQVLVGLRATEAKTGATVYTSQGDLFSIWGARCKPDRPHPLGWERCLPSEDRCKGEYEWNHYKVVGNNGTLKLHVNGKEVSGVSDCNPRKGYLALESEGSECRFKNLKIKELPSTNPKRGEVCDLDKGWKCMFTGLDLTGWKVGEEEKSHWKMADGVISYDGKGKGKTRLWSDKAFGDFELICDWRSTDPKDSGVDIRGEKNSGFAFRSRKKAGEWNRTSLTAKGNRSLLRVNGDTVADGVFPGLTASGPIALVGDGAVQIRNVFIRELKAGE